MAKIKTPEKLSGLSQAEANDRIKKYGYNELPSSKRRNTFHIIKEVLQEPMFLLLLFCGFIYFLLDESREAWILLSFVFFIIGITIYQERKTEKALMALRDLSSPRALVVRSGAEMRIPGREVVRDDIIIINEGDRIPADAVVLVSENLYIDESLLTGESVPVHKKVWQGQSFGQPGGDGTPFVYSGTLVVRGRATIQAQATGFFTEMGKIGKALETLKIEKTELHKQTAAMVKKFAAIGLLLCFIVVMILILTRQNWLESILAGIALAMSILPEEFPVVMTIFLALGAWRISRHQVLARRIPAVEALGAITTLCVDKTGTLTMNKMEIGGLCVEGDNCFITKSGQHAVPENFHNLVNYAFLASAKNSFDPMERAIKDFRARALSALSDYHSEWELLKEYPLSEKMTAMANVWRVKNEKEFVVAAKGAPESIIDLCHLSPEKGKEVMKQVAKMADKGLRVLGVASAAGSGKLPGDKHDFKFNFLGLVGFEDPIRPEVPEAVRECYEAGIRVIMITGDYPGTAQKIAEKIGLKHTNKIIIGSELEKMSDKELNKKISQVSIFARTVPEQKLRLVEALKANREVVAMTGDGVNDAPALKAAHVGVAMGGRGTDVAREAAALVLLDDNFASIVAAIKMGRRIYDNIKKAVTYIFSVHVLIAGLAVLPIIFGWPLILLPLHIVFLELIIDPACSIIFEMEKEENDLMKRRPRRLKSKLFSRRVSIFGFLQGLSVLVATALLYFYAVKAGSGEDEARTFAFVSIVIGNLGLIFSNRSRTRSLWSIIRTPNPSVWFISAGAIGFLALILSNQASRELFKFSLLDLREFSMILVVAIVAVLIPEILKIPKVQRIIER